MNSIRIDGGIRTKLTKSEKSQIRNSGGAVGVIYGNQMTPTPMYVSADSVKSIVAHHGHGLVELRLAGQEPIHAMIQDFNRDPLTKKVINIDFLAVSLNEPVEAEVPIYLNGLETAEKSGGVIQQQMRAVMIRALPTSVPEHLMIDISGMKIGDKLTASQIPMPVGCELISDPDEMVVMLMEPRNASPETEIEPKEPELVHDTEGKGKEAVV